MDASSVIADRLRQLRAEKRMTQEELSAVTGINPAYISFIEGGKRKPTIPTVEKMARGLQTSLEELFKGL